MSEFSERLSNLREEKGWSKTYVAKAVGLKSMQTYANWEYGRTEPDFEMATKLANLFNTTTDYLLSGKQSKADQVHNMSVDEALGTIMSFEGKPVTDRDKRTMKDLLESYLRNRGE
ncbi:MAG: helix-turn-helix transcriptional regulator [Ruminococcus flavefaciens]|nr:helix-turn-helix transcriptional regulator [Ruminococcus flavefaciens]